MTYVKQTWADGSAGGTPVSAARLAYMEAGIAAAYDDTLLTVGEEVMSRRWAVTSSAVATGSGSLRLSYFTARKSETITRFRIRTGATAAGATPTLCRAGLWTVADNGGLTLVAAIDNDTTLFAAANTAYTRSLGASPAASYAKVAGLRYAFGVLVVTTATAPTLIGQVAAGSAELLEAPVVTAVLTGQTNLPSSIAAGTLTANGNMPYGVLLPAP